MSRRRAIVGGAAIVLVLSGGMVWAQSADTFDPAAVAAAERQQLIDARRQSAEAEARAARLEDRAEVATNAADAARSRAAAIAARIQAAEADITAGEARLALVRRNLGAAQSRLAAQQEPLARLTGAMQLLSRRPAIAVLAQPGSVQEVAHMRAILASTRPLIVARTRALRVDLDRLASARRASGVALDALRASRADLTRQRTALARLEADRRMQSRELMSSARLESTRALGLGEQARDIVELMESLESDAARSAALAQLAGPIPRPADPTQAGSAPADRAPDDRQQPAYRLPVVGRIVTGFGEVAPSGVRSRGVTLSTQPGAQVVAPASGRVVFAGDYRGYGRILILDHADGWTTLVTGLIGTGVAVGDRVDQGDPVGRAGPANPHVTVELRRQGRPVDLGALIG